MTDTIMVAIDGEPAHRGALDWATARAIRTGARLVLASVIERTWNDDPDEPSRRLVDAADERLRDELRSLGQRRDLSAVTDIRTRILYGKVAHQLTIAAHEADMLVVGTRSGIDRERSFTGSLAVRAATAAPCPVAVVPHGWTESGSTVVVGVDGDVLSEVAVAFAADEAHSLGQPLRIVCTGYTANPLLAGFVPDISLGDRRQRIVEDATHFARELRPDLDVSADVLEAAPARGLVEAAEGASILVLGTHDRHGARRMMLGSVGHDVLLNVRTPVVIARNRRDDAEEEK